MTDGALIREDILLRGMMDEDPWIRQRARQIWDQAHAGEPEPQELSHCSECFEGCPKCKPEMFK